MISRVAALAAGALVLSGCGSAPPRFDHLFYQDSSEAPSESKVSLRPLEIQIGKGIAVKAHVLVIGTDGVPMPNPDFQSSDPTIFEADPGPNAGDFVFYGVDVGAAELDVYSGANYEASIPVTVLSPN